MPTPTTQRSVALVTLGCTRNDVDSEELAGRLSAAGWLLVDDADQADVAVVNTCGFIEQAKKDSIDAVLEASDLKAGPGRTQAVVAVGCLAERYGEQLAAELPEADAVLGFDSYTNLATHLGDILAGSRPASHTPKDRRTLLPIAPVSRPAASVGVALPGHGSAATADSPGPASGPRVVRARLDGRPWAPLKIASGCDRRCSFCAIPVFRGSFVSRPPAEIVSEARWLAERGVSEVFLVSENSTSYGKDLGDLTLMERLLPELAAVQGIERVRVSYLQPAEIRPRLLDVIADTPEVAPYFDISFQHASGPLLRRMRRFGDREGFLGLIDDVRRRVPAAGIRSNVIVGFPGESSEDVQILVDFLTQARLDVVGVFGYSDEDGTHAFSLDGHLPDDVVAQRVADLTDLVEELTAQRAEDRIGELVRVLVEEVPDTDADLDLSAGMAQGRSAHQGPDIDGVTILRHASRVAVGDYLDARVTASNGVDLIAEPLSGT